MGRGVMEDDMGESKTLAQKVAAAMGEVGAVKHDAKNDFSNYTYTSAAAVLAKVQKALSKHGVAISSELEELQSTWGKSQKGSAQWLYVTKCRVTLSDGSDDAIRAEGIGAGMDTGDKAPMKATTAAYKYALSTALCIGLGDDPEADTRTDADAPAQQQSNKQPAQPPKKQQKTQPTMCHPDGPHAQQEGAIMALSDLQDTHLDEYHGWVTQRVLATEGPNKQKVFAHLRKVQSEYERRGRDVPQDEAAE